MLIFHCSDCKETINSADDESVKQVFDRLDEHMAKCPRATFTFEGTTDVARQRADNLRSVIKALRVSYGHTDARAQRDRFLSGSAIVLLT